MGNILLPKHYHPDFRLNNKRPVCNVKPSSRYNPTGIWLSNNIPDVNIVNNYIVGNIVGQPALKTNGLGVCMDLNSGDAYSIAEKMEHIAPDQNNFCFLYVRKPKDTTKRQSTTSGFLSGGIRFGAHIPWIDGRIYFDVDSITNRIVYEGYTKQLNRLESWLFSVSSSGMELWLNGELLGYNTQVVQVPHPQTEPFYINLGGGLPGDEVELYMLASFGYKLSHDESKKITEDPFGELLKPANDQYYFVPDGGGAGGDNYSGTATSTNTSTSTASGQKTSTGTATSTADDTTTTASFKTGLGNVTSINTASTAKTGLAIMLGTAISLNVAATTTTGTKSETATGTATSSNTATATTSGDKTGLGTATSNNTSTTTADGVQSGTGAGSATSTNTALTATTGSKSGLGLVSSVNGYLITLQSNAIMLGTAASSNTSESTVIGLSENDASGTLTSTSTIQTITAGNKIGLGDVDSANTSATTTTATTDREGTLTSANTSSAIVSGANTAAPVIIRSVDLVCELPYILLTRAIDGSLFMAYPPEVSNITTAYQNNDTNINVVITDNGEAVSMGSITEAEYVIASRDKSQTLVNKSLGSGISKGSDQLVLSLSQADTSALLDIYYHELQITSDGKHATVFAEHINFIDTVI